MTPFHKQIMRNFVIREDDLLLAKDAKLRDWSVGLVPAVEERDEIPV